MSAADTIERAPAVMKAGTSLRTRAWWVMRAMPVFSMHDLLMTCATSDDKAGRKNLERYLSGLLRAGVIDVLPKPTAAHQTLWRLVRDLGPEAPSVSHAGEMNDRNAAPASGPAAARNRSAVLDACRAAMPTTIHELCRVTGRCVTVVRRHLRDLELTGDVYRVPGPGITDPDLWMATTCAAQRRAAAERAASQRNQHRK